MKKNLKNEEMDIVFLLDRSGSMAGSESDTIGGYNSYLKEQKGENVKVTTVLFDHEYELLHNRKNINEVLDLTNKEYFVRGCTALLDAIGKTIELVDKSGSKKVMFVITTDGLENASKLYTKEQINELIKGHSNWEFIYIGANIDSYAEGSKLGIKSTNIANYEKTKDGVSKMFSSVAKASAIYRECATLSEEWKEDLN